MCGFPALVKISIVCDRAQENRSYLHVKFDLNFNLSNVISQLGNIVF